jgi:hypothetical protein
MSTHQIGLPSILTLLAVLAAGVPTAGAQTVEITPVVGYRFGGDFYELVTRQPVDNDGGPAFGLAVDIRIDSDLFVEALYTRQEASFRIQPGGFNAGGPRFRVSVEQVQVGGLRELEYGRVRPFLTGTLGFTRYGTAGDHEVRFSGAAGGGVKLYPTKWLAARFDGRLFGTLVDADLDALFCTPGLCIGSFDVWAVWQLEFVATVTIAF